MFFGIVVHAIMGDACPELSSVLCVAIVDAWEGSRLSGQLGPLSAWPGSAFYDRGDRQCPQP